SGTCGSTTGSSSKSSGCVHDAAADSATGWVQDGAGGVACGWVHGAGWSTGWPAAGVDQESAGNSLDRASGCCSSFSSAGSVSLGSGWVQEGVGCHILRT